MFCNKVLLPLPKEILNGTQIDGTTMEYAKAIMNYLIAQKFELMPPEIRLTNSSESATGLDKAQLNQFPLVGQYASKVAKVLLHKDTSRVSSTVIAQGKIQPPLPLPDPAPEKFIKFPTESVETIASRLWDNPEEKNLGTGKGSYLLSTKQPPRFGRHSEKTTLRSFYH